MIKQLFLILIHIIKMNLKYLNRKKYKILNIDNGKVQLLIKN